MQASDRFNINLQLEHLQVKYVGTGHADLNRLKCYCHAVFLLTEKKIEKQHHKKVCHQNRHSLHLVQCCPCELESLIHLLCIKSINHTCIFYCIVCMNLEGKLDSVCHACLRAL